MDSLRSFWQQRSLRFWLATGLILAIAPVWLFATLGYFRLHDEIVRPLVDVTTEQRTILQPLNHIEVRLWDVSQSVIGFSAEGLPADAEKFALQRAEIDSAFDQLSKAVTGNANLRQQVARVEADWRQVADGADRILALPPIVPDMDEIRFVVHFEHALATLGHDLAQLYGDIRIDNEQSHFRALAAVERFDVLALSALVLSLMLGVLGIWIINRSLVSSMRQLSKGAMRFARGDPDHRIEVRIPHELAGVADTFNVMRETILAQQRELEAVAITDELTGLHNLRHFDHALRQELLRAERFAGQFCLILLDIDHFKRFNDTYGHQQGDAVLKQVATLLRETVRRVDVVCRYGGEEFAIIMPNCGVDQCSDAAGRLRRVMADLPIPLDDGTMIAVTGSFGGAVYPEHATSAEGLVRRADVALYEAKRQGRNRVHLADEVAA
ncbi:MAG: diguanylate cyclase [Marinobacter sp.]|uniref:GGDEF domain-containing protein n=1 Tax=Marinobacter sp. TaxID=50741 RepID=UPI00299E9AF7|nr:diguanylate cyclase [Marinobacter sp.]MDX1756191.1 diguanylate cyclase [Marinobacter sp.]